jgi:hypothetical protein
VFQAIKAAIGETPAKRLETPLNPYFNGLYGAGPLSTGRLPTPPSGWLEGGINEYIKYNINIYQYNNITIYKYII